MPSTTLGTFEITIVSSDTPNKFEHLATLRALVFIDRHLFEFPPFCLVRPGAWSYHLSSDPSQQTFPGLLLHHQEGLSLFVVHLHYPDLGFRA